MSERSELQQVEHDLTIAKRDVGVGRPGSVERAHALQARLDGLVSPVAAPAVAAAKAKPVEAPKAKKASKKKSAKK